MNKIVIDKENYIEINNENVILDIKVEKVVIDIKGQVIINEIDYKDIEKLDIEIRLNPYSSLIYNRFMIHNSINNKVKIIQDNNSNIIFNYSLIANDECKLDILSELCGNNNQTEIKVKGVTLNKGRVVISTSASVKENIKDNNLLETIKVLLLNDLESVIIPNLLVASNEVIVNHAATLSPVNNDELQYLMGKGLSLDNARNLIKNGFLISNLVINDEEKERIKELLDGGE